MDTRTDRVETEKYTLTALIKFPDLLAEYNFFTDENFSIDINKSIFSCIKNRYNSGQPISTFIITQYLQKIGIYKYGNLEIGDYLSAMEGMPMTEKAGKGFFEELKKYNLRKNLWNVGAEIQKVAKVSGEKTEEQIINDADKVYSSMVLATHPNLKMEDPFENLEAEIEKRANNPIVEIGYKSPFPKFNEIFGGFRPKNVYAFVARAKAGKSLLLNHLLREMCILNNCEGLYLDTEMDTESVRFRNASALTEVPMWHLETGNFKKHAKHNATYEKNKHKLKQYEGLVTHIHVPGVPVENIISMVKRWYYGKVKNKGKRCIVVYDYIKLTGEENNKYRQEYQLIGDKINALKELCSQLDIPLLTACQLNRTGEEKDDSTAIAMSDRLSWFASFVAIFRKKRADERNNEVGDYGTHKMIPLVTRYQGENGYGSNEFIQVTGADGKTTNVVNYLNFDVKNFFVQEKGALSDIIRANATGKLVVDEAEDTGAEF